MECNGSSMILRQLNPGACRTYLVGSELTKEAAIIDPVLERVEEYLKILAGGGWQIRYVIDTHTHADHLSGSAALADRTGADFAMHKKSPVHCLNLRLSDGSALRVGDVLIEAIDTPGHTKDSLSLKLPGRLLTGDWLFIGGAGRTDLPGGDPAEHWDSLHRVLPGLPDEILIYPAHDYQNQAYSTLENERATNPNLRERSREEYATWLAALAQPTPEWMIQTLEANYACAMDPRESWKPVDAPACMATCQPVASANAQPVAMVSPEEVRTMLSSAEPPFLLDVRQPEEYVGPLGHLPGAILIPLGELASRLPEMDLHQERSVVTICKGGVRSTTAAGILLQAGFKKVFSLAGGTEAWNKNGYPVER